MSNDPSVRPGDFNFRRKDPDCFGAIKFYEQESGNPMNELHLGHNCGLTLCFILNRHGRVIKVQEGGSVCLLIVGRHEMKWNEAVEVGEGGGGEK